MRAHEWLAGLAAVLLTACGGGGRGTPPARTEGSATGDPAYVSESERTRQMEADADEARRRLEEARASGATGEDAVKAYEEFERERARINATAEGSAGEAPADEAYGVEPPPE